MFKNFVLFLVLFFLPAQAFAVISCSVSATCSSPSVVLLRMSGTSNAHAELPSQSNYSNLLCCGGVTDLANSCTNDYEVVLRLSGDTNAHVEENTGVTTAYDGSDACLSVPDGTVTIAYSSTNCSGYDATIASLSSSTTNAHVGAAADYSRKICATVTSSGGSGTGGGGVGGNRPSMDARGCRIADLNCDSRVDIMDLSILLYYYDSIGLAPEYYDLKADNQINLLDVSVMFYYWDQV